VSNSARIVLKNKGGERYLNENGGDGRMRGWFVIRENDKKLKK